MLEFIKKRRKKQAAKNSRRAKQIVARLSDEELIHFTSGIINVFSFR